MMTEDEWVKLKERRMKSIRSSIEVLRANEEPKLRIFRAARLMGQINELRIVGLFTSEEALTLNAATAEARKEAREASLMEVDQSDDD